MQATASISRVELEGIIRKHFAGEPYEVSAIDFNPDHSATLILWFHPKPEPGDGGKATEAYRERK